MRAAGIIKVRHYKTPCGELLLGASGEQLCLCDWLEKGYDDIPHAPSLRLRASIEGRINRLLHVKLEAGDTQVLEDAMSQLDEYFAGERKQFDLPLLMLGTAFQQLVWSTLSQIPYGAVVSYGELAHIIGRPRSVRATANACGANSISVILPCHRVVGADHSLTGYGGGLERKRYLLTLEQKSSYLQGFF